MPQGGEDFRLRFAAALLTPIKAADVSKPAVSGRGPGDPSARVYAARDAVWRAIDRIGGINSVAASCVWDVFGLDRPLLDWATERGWGREAEMILIEALRQLAQHFGHPVQR